MKYYINGRFLTQRITGVQRYAREVTLALDLLLQDTPSDHNEYTILTPKNFTDKLSCRRIHFKTCGHLSGHLWEQIELPYYAKDGYLLNFCNCAPLIKKNQAVTIHDTAIATFPEAYSWKFRLWYRIMYTVLGKRLKTIFTVSFFSRNELNKYFGISKKNIHITYNGSEHLLRLRPDYSILRNVPQRYILAVSSQNPTKNFKLIIELAKRLSNIDFVIVGGRNNKIFSNIEEMNLSNLHYLGYVTDECLIALYQNARAFLYPSLYEGFGIPPLEAMINKCPVITSKCASLPEVCGDAALYIDSQDIDSDVNCLKNIFQNNTLRENLIDAGKKRSTVFSWKFTAKKIYTLVNNDS